MAFLSLATNLVPGDTNGVGDIFVHDRRTGETTRVSVSSAGVQGNGPSNRPSISNSGRFVAFESLASNLVPGDTNDTTDVFVHDRRTGVTTRVSVDSAGNQGNDFSCCHAISDDGRYVAFASLASNLVPGDTNGAVDVFVHDLQTRVTTRVSVDSAGHEGNGDSGVGTGTGDARPAISRNGRYVVFDSNASNLVPGDTNGHSDIFLHDRRTGVTTRVSVDSAGNEADMSSFRAGVSADGLLVAFQSFATNLVPGDTNGNGDVFVRDLRRGVTIRVSVDSAGNEADFGVSLNPIALTPGGRYVLYDAAATNLVPGDTGFQDVFVHDVKHGRTVRASVDSAGNQADGTSMRGAMSDDGRYVAFDSDATNLVPGDTNGVTDIFVRDMD